MAGSAASEVTVDGLKRVLGAALGDDRLRAVGPDEPLLRSGVITSIELVGLLVELEKRFGVPGLGGKVSPSALTLAALVALLGGHAAAAAPAGTGGRYRGLRRLARRPWAALVSFGLWFALLNLATEALFQTALRPAYLDFLEQGKRLYPYSGDLSQDNFRFAFQFHEIHRPAAPGERTVAVFGDSGTIGSYLEAGEALPAQIERSLRASGVPARGMNLAWYGQLLAKDLMLLELAWDQPLDTVVLTVGERYFNKQYVELWSHALLHPKLGWPLFRDFAARVPPGERAPFLEVQEMLARADLRSLGPARRLAFSSIPLLHRSPFLKYALNVKALPAWISTGMRRNTRTMRNERFALVGNPPEDLTYGLRKEGVDWGQVAILTSVVKLLEQRGTRVVLYLEPQAPVEWKPAQAGPYTAADLAARVAHETGATVVDLTWALHREDFLDSTQHYTPEANRRIGDRIAEAVRLPAAKPGLPAAGGAEER